MRSLNEFIIFLRKKNLSPKPNYSNNLSLQTHIINNIAQSIDYQGKWDDLVHQKSSNPLMYSSFIGNSMKYYDSIGWESKVIILSNSNEIYSIMPIRIKREYGIKYAKLLLQPEFSPEIIVNKNQEECIRQNFNVIFNELKCSYVDITLSAQSENINTIKKVIKKDEYYCRERKEKYYKLLDINSSWEDYSANLPSKSRKQFSYESRKISKYGKWKINKYIDNDIDKKKYQLLLEIEKNSWKEEWRKKNNINEDPDYKIIWDSFFKKKIGYKDFSVIIYLLEFEDINIAHTVVLKHNNDAMILKTSYNDNYRTLYPGKIILHKTIQDIFSDGICKKIDLLTDLEYLKYWTKKSIPRIRMVISKNRTIVKAVDFYTSNIQNK